jgi:hypothetical protein
MVLSALAAVFRPVVMLWVGLNALDDLSVVMRLGRLVMSVLPGTDRSALCDVCDDVMGDLLTTGGIDAIPCRLACFRSARVPRLERCRRLGPTEVRGSSRRPAQSPRASTCARP